MMMHANITWHSTIFALFFFNLQGKIFAIFVYVRIIGWAPSPAKKAQMWSPVEWSQALAPPPGYPVSKLHKKMAYLVVMMMICLQPLMSRGLWSSEHTKVVRETLNHYAVMYFLSSQYQAISENISPVRGWRWWWGQRTPFWLQNTCK